MDDIELYSMFLNESNEPTEYEGADLTRSRMTDFSNDLYEGILLNIHKESLKKAYYAPTILLLEKLFLKAKERIGNGDKLNDIVQYYELKAAAIIYRGGLNYFYSYFT